MIVYAPATRDSMMESLRAALDAADPLPGRLRLYSGPQPGAGDPITTETLLADIELEFPCGVVANGVLTLATPVEDSNLPDSGTIAWGRLVDGNDIWIADLDVGVEGSGAAVELAGIIVYQGGIVRITAAALTLV